MADAFAAAKYDVFVTDVDAAALEDCPTNWHHFVVDVRDEKQMQDIFSEVGALEVLCANAGVAGPTELVEDISISDWQDCISVNLDGAFIAAKCAVPAMKVAGRGSIVLTSSTAGLFGYPHRAPYAAAKWAVIGLMKTLAMELGPFGIRANAICPGAVEGPRMEGVLAREAAAKGMSRDDVYRGYAAGTSMRRFVEAEDIANMAVFLGSRAARLVSGQVIAVDGHTENPDPKL